MFLFFVYSVITLMRIAESGEFVSNTLGSNMVIQRGKTSFIWGKSSAPGSEISINVGDIFDVTTKSGETFSGGGFSYVAEVPAMGASLDPLTITVSSNVGESQIMTNVLVGDVFFCSGQSNMEFSMPGVFNASEEIAKADNYPNIRLFTVHSDLSWPQTCGNSPQDELCSVLQPWSVASADSIGSSLKSDDGEYNYDVWSKFSGVCWYFGVNTYVHQLHGNVPVGLIASAWGGTIIEAWTQPDDTSACRLEADPSSPAVGDSAETHVSADFDPTQPGALFNSMVHPFRYFSIRGIVWYQGESNMRNSMIENDFYTCMQPRLLNTWRGMGPGFDGANMVFTQVAPWTWHFTPQGYKGIYTFRQAQYNVLQRVPQGTMAMVTAADLGDPESPYSDIHPREKSEVGRRLALAAQYVMYGGTRGVRSSRYLGPSITEATIVADKTFGYKVQLSFDDGDIHLKSPQECPAGPMSGRCGYIELVAHCHAEEGHCITKANLILKKAPKGQPNTIMVVPYEHMTSVPVQLRYALGDYPLMQIYDREGIPLLPLDLDLAV